MKIPIRICVALGGLFIFVFPVESDTTHTFEMISSPLTIYRVYRSMEGPVDTRVVTLTDSTLGQQGDLVWLTGLKTEILDAESHEPRPQEYLCHITFASNKKIFKSNAVAEHMKYQYPKLLSLFQGEIQMRFPKHFAMPALSTDAFLVASMVLNNNGVPQKPFQLKVKNTLDYIYDKDINYAMKPLMRRSYILKVPVKEMSGAAHCDFEEGNEITENPPEEKAARAAKGSLDWLEKDADGNIQSIHWMVPPGRHIYRYRLPAGLEIPDDTTVHYISVHLHPFGQYMAIKDLTTGKIVFKGRVKNFKDRKGIAQSDYYSDAEGMLLQKEHEYELICEYNNTTSEDVDAMAMMLVFYLDKTFDKSQLTKK